MTKGGRSKRWGQRVKSLDVSVFWQFFVLYLLLFLLSISVLLVFILPTTLRSARTIDQERYANCVNEVCDYVRGLLSNIESAKSALERSEWFEDLFFQRIVHKEALTYDEREDIQKALQTAAAQMREFRMAAFVLDGDDTLYNSYSLTTDWTKYQKYDLTPSVNYRFFSLQPGESPGLALLPYGQDEAQYTALVYRSDITNLYKTSVNRPKGQFNMVLNAYRVEQSILSLLSGRASAFRLLDASGEAVLHFPFGQEADPSLVTLFGEVGGYRLEVLVDEALYHKNEWAMRKTLFLIALADTALCLVAIFLFSRKNYMPINRLSAQLPAAGGAVRQNEIDLLDAGIRSLKSQNERAQSELDALRPLFKQQFLMNLLNGEKIAPEDQARLPRYGIEFPYPAFRVLCLRPGAAPDAGDGALAAAAKITALSETMRADLDLRVYAHALESGRISLILNYQDAQALATYVARLSQSGPLTAGVGGAVNCPEQIYVSAQAALHALNHSAMHGGGVAWADRLPEAEGASYHYPMADEITLLGALASGRADTAGGVLEKLFRENAAYACASRQGALCLYYDLLSSLQKAAQAAALDPEKVGLARAEPRGSLFELCADLRDLSARVCQAVANQRDEQQPPALDKQVLSYIEQNLYNPDLSLAGVADAFHVSMPYVSTLFKAGAGISYSEYVNKARIREAARLLRETDLPTEEVAKRTGYISMSTFRRNFIKYAGTNPGQFNRGGGG